jgi:hypothetical protein
MRACRRYSVPPFTVAHSVPRLPLKAAGGRTEVLAALWIWMVLHPMNSQQPTHKERTTASLTSMFCCLSLFFSCYNGRGFLFLVPLIFWGFFFLLSFLFVRWISSYISPLLRIPTGGTNWHAFYFCSDISPFSEDWIFASHWWNEMNVIIYRLAQLDSTRLIWPNFVFWFRQDNWYKFLYFALWFCTCETFSQNRIKIILTFFVRRVLNFPRRM